MNMKKEFRIGQSNEVLKGANLYDLHNSYDFVGLAIKTKDRTLEMFFDPNPAHGGDKPPIALKFEGLDYLEFSSNFGTREVTGLEEMGYKSANDRDDQWLLDEQQSTPDDHLFFRFDDGDFVRIHCQHADIAEIARKIS